MTESKQPQKGRIFISYRRADSAGYAGRIYDRLVDRFGEDAIFMDVDTIEGGVDFVKVLEDAVQSCDVLIALIGRQWLNIKDTSGKRRLDNPEDFVRIEVATALMRNIRVIPVLVDGIEMPRSTDLPENLKDLARRNALQVNHHSFNPDVYRLVEHTNSALDEAEISRVMKAQALQSARERAAKEKAELKAAENLAQEQAAKEVRRVFDKSVKKAKRDLRWGKLKNNIQLRLQMIWIYRIPILILIVALAIIVPLLTDLLNDAPELTQTLDTTPVVTNTLSTPLIPLSKTTEPIQPSRTPTITITPTESFTLTATLLPIEITDAKGVSMMLVPAGEFTMGFSADVAFEFCITISTNIVWYSPPCSKDDYLQEEPVHAVYLSNFFMDVFEVSNEEYKKCVADTVCESPSSNGANRYSHYYDNENFHDYPVLNVTWDMAKTYCEWRGARLPTEAEWEKAARGKNERTHPWGTFNPAYEIYDPIFYDGRANVNIGSFSKPTMPVTSNSKGLSPYELYNMSGNVAEWVADWYSETYYEISPYENPLGPSSGAYKVIRGGSVNTYEARTTARDFRKPSDYESGIGFRCVMDIP